jgi:hypothetical protein
MTQDLAATHDQFSDLSLKKQIVYRRYANGEVSWSEAAQDIERIQPPPPKLSKKQRVAYILSAYLLALLIPPWAKREGD